MKLSKTITIIVFLALISSIANAEDFTTSAPTKLNVFQCSTHNYDIYVQNLGNNKNQYFLETDTNIPEWVSINSERFSLEPGQAIKLQETIEIPCDAHGEKWVDFYITTLDSAEKLIQQDITIYKPENIKIIDGVFNQTIDACKTANYKAKFENEFDFAETYKLSLENKKYNTQIDPQTFELQKNQTKEVKINITPKDCELSGEQTPTLNINTEKTKLNGEIDLLLKINKNTPTAKIQTQTITTNYDKKTSTIKLQNAFNRKIKYDLRLRELEWASLEPKTVTIDSGKTAEINITTEPNANLTPGTYEAKLQVFDDEGKEHTQIIKINLKKPIDYKKWSKRIGIGVGSAILFILILTITIKLTSRKARLRRKEKREEKERLKKELKKELQKEYRLISKKELRKKRKTTKWFFTTLLFLAFLITPFVLHYYSKRNLFLAKTWILFSLADALLLLLTIIIGSLILLVDWEKVRKNREQRKKELNEKKLQEAKPKKQEVFLEHKQTQKTTQKDPAILKKIILTLITIAVLGAIVIFAYLFRTTLTQYKEWTITGFAILSALIIIISYLSTRSRKIKYKFLESRKKQEIRTKWRKGLLSTFFTTNKDVQNFKIKIKKRSGSILIKPSANIYQYFRIQSNQEEFQQIEFITKIKKSWLKRRELKESDIKIKIYNQTAWDNIKTEKTGEDNKYIYYLSTTNKTGTFAIVCPGEHKTKKTWGVYLSLFLLLGASIALVTLLTSQEIGQKGIPEQKIYKNEAKKLELSKYFTDPDNDKLNFSHTETQNIKIEIIDGTATMTPPYNWVGQEFIKFTASDGKDTTESNEVRIIVQEKTPIELIKKYALPVGLGILIFLIIGFMFAYRKELLDFLEEE